MNAFDIQGPTRTCAISGKSLAVGEKFYGVLVEENGKFVRKDYSVPAWQAPPEDAIAYWLGRIPNAEKPRKPTINDELLLDCFDHLAAATETNRLAFRYVVALLLMRRKRLKFEDTRRNADGSEILIVRDARNGIRLEILDPRLNEEEILSVQDEVFQVLGWE